MEEIKLYDVAIIGGGLAGLSTAIQLRKMGYSVVLFEKEAYPFHKVCGEYISYESWDFLESLGLPLSAMNLPQIDTLHLTAPNGASFTTRLPLGGFGISRYTLDHQLATIAEQGGVVLLQETKVEEVNFNDNVFELGYRLKAAGVQQVRAKVCCAAYGKRSNIDVKWKRLFLQRNNPKINNQVGIKYHIRTQWKENVIGLHNFSGGYCGISKVDEDMYCLCYLVGARKLRECNNSIPHLQQKVLYENKALKAIFLNSEVMQDFPITISQISFSSKTRVENGVLMLGDAAGMITPLCGNGMSMAMHSSKMAATCIQAYLQNVISRQELEKQYNQAWQKEFKRRLQTGRTLQQFFGSNFLSNLFVATFNLFPFLAKGIIKKTHGKRF